MNTNRAFTLPSTAEMPPPPLRQGTSLYLACVAALAIGGALLGVRLAASTSGHELPRLGAPGVGLPVRTSFGSLEVESVQQIRGLTPKALAGMTHGIQSLVRADQMQVQLVVALRNDGDRAERYDPGRFRLRVTGGGTSRTFGAVATSVRAGVLPPRSAMETTLGFVVKRVNPPRSRITLELVNAPGDPFNLDLGPVRPAGATAAEIQSLYQGHHHSRRRRP